MNHSSSKTRRISNELFKYENEGTAEKLECYLVNHDESQMIFVKFIPQEFLVNIVLNFSDMYPFKPPSITINGHNYLRLLIINEEWKLKYIDARCLCCLSLIHI